MIWRGSPAQYHSTRYVASLMNSEGLPAYGHDIGDHFAIGPVRVEVTPADHAWQNESPGASDRIFQPEDCCGFWIDTPDGTIWAPGDSRLIPDHHLRMPTPDAMLFDFSDSEWHFGLDGAIEMANAYPNTPLLLYHWGCVDAPDFPPFNADPDSLPDRVDNPERIQVLAPGEPFDAAATARLISPATQSPESSLATTMANGSLMSNDGMRRIGLFQVCDLVLGQRDGEGSHCSLQMGDLCCPDDRRCHRLLL